MSEQNSLPSSPKMQQKSKVN